MSHTNADRPVKGQKVTSNVTSSTIKSQEKDVEVEISRLKRENQHCIQNLSMLEGEHRALEKSMTEQLKHWAKNLARLSELGQYDEPINHICATICRELAQKNLFGSIALARRELDSIYKQGEFTPHNLPSSQVEFDTSVPAVEPNNPNWDSHIFNSPHYQQPPQFDYVHDQVQQGPVIPEKSIDLMSDDELRDYTEAISTKERKDREAHLESRRRAREARERCHLKKIALSPEFETLGAEDHVSALSPDSGPSAAWEACLKVEEAYGKLADKLYRWRPPKKIADDLKLAFEEEADFLKTFIDEKYRECQPAWWIVQCNNIFHGKHAAAIMAACPISEKEKRALTREQVGDRQAEDLLKAVRFVAAQKAKVKLWWWFHEMNRKGIARRAKELNPVLSEKSFT